MAVISLDLSPTLVCPSTSLLAHAHALTMRNVRGVGWIADLSARLSWERQSVLPSMLQPAR